MRRTLLVLTVAAIMAVMSAAPAMASHDEDGWWDNCSWAYSLGWGWFLVCEPEDNDWWWGPSWDDNTVVSDDDDGNGGNGRGDDAVLTDF